MSSGARSGGRPGWRHEAHAIDRALYAAVAATPTPRLDDAMRRVAKAADYSRLSLTASALLVVGGGTRGRRAAVSGLAATALTSGVVNLVLKRVQRRQRPDRRAEGVAVARHVRMPSSPSFPSGHAASAFAFASGAGQVLPLASAPLHALAAVVGYSRVHTGVHYPADVIAGAVIGEVMADLSPSVVARVSRRAPWLC